MFLHFRHQGVVNTYISSVYANDRFYLSVNDLFDALSIDIDTDTGALTISGNYIGQGNYFFNLDRGLAGFRDVELTLTADDYIISDFGYYLLPEIFYELFEMEFIIDFGNLSVSLVAPDTMPVVAQRERERRRERTMRTQRELRREFYPLRYDRNQQVFNGGFIDYNVSANMSQNSESLLYSTSIGSELFGGDLQGTIFGSYSETSSSLRSSGLRWRYGVRDNDWISSVVAGQTSVQGLVAAAYTGVRVTNEPIEPRYLYGETAFTGTVEPNSEVELYRNNTLVDFAEADETGFYRFTVPITYGASNYSIRTFSPTGEVSERDARLQIPFNFLPPGEVNYTLNAGRLDNPIAGSTERGLLTNADVSVGLSNRFTATGGVEYFEDFHDGLPTFKTGISTRLFTNYLVSFQAASEAFYRVSGSVIYPNNASINLDYTYFNAESGIYNPSRNLSSIRANVFTPFEIGSLPLFLRWTVTNEQRIQSDITRYRVDLNTRIGRANFRLGYRDSQLGRLSFQSTPVARVNSAVTYNLTRSRDLPRMLRGLFLRGQTNFIPSQSRFEDAELQISRNISQRGRFQVAGGRNFTGDFNLFRFSLTYDFSRARSTSTVRTTRTATTFTQSVRGSVGYDSNHNRTILTNREQVGRSGVAVRMFVDNNNSGTFDEGDELIPGSAVRIDRAGGNQFSRNGISYISQLQPYRQYNMTVNNSAINNPLLVAESEQFSIITDPNQYKLIEIPFYMSGIIDGMVYRTDEAGNRNGVGGLRLFLRQVNVPEGMEPINEELRTFSDGSFYGYEIPPGDYTLTVDPSQLSFLDARSEPEILEFTVDALAEGDFVDNLEINLFPADAPESVRPDDPIISGYLAGPGGHELFRSIPEECRFIIYPGSFLSFNSALQASGELDDLYPGGLELGFNAGNSLYWLRSAETYSASGLPQMISDYMDQFSDPVGFLNSCADRSFDEGADNIYLQIGTFENRNQALFVLEQFEDVEPASKIYTDQSDQIYRLLRGPYSSREQITADLQRLVLSDGLGSITVPEPSELIPVDAIPPLSVTIDQGQQIQIITDATETVTPEREVDEPVTDRDPLEDLYLLSSSLTRAASFHPSTYGITFPLPVRAPIARVTPERPETVIIEPEIELTEPDATFTLPPLEDETEPLEYDLEDCAFPVQAGSYRGSANAWQIAQELTERSGRELSLYYNSLTNLYALRTDPLPSLSKAKGELLRLRESDPTAQYALIGACSSEEHFNENVKASYLIPLTGHDAEDTDALAAELSEETGMNFITANHPGIETELFSGPFENYYHALEAREELLDLGYEVKDVIRHPESENQFRAHFQIFIGSNSDYAEALSGAEEYKKISGREYIILIDNRNISHLFDSAVYSSWSEFLDELRSLPDIPEHDTIEIILFD
ncbi:MAG: SPOR domain-containing protein [Balneolaceae bacterium]|nr:SPOR domain-containing protein [Balneolaceae bacterium]MCH8548669.1 SPOR domain-containing protein [Balneolaceae bacterium]